MCPATPPQVVESWARTPTLPDDESTSELEPGDAEPRLQPQSPSDAASGRGTSDPEHRHPSVQDDGGKQNEGFVAPPQARESRASMPRSLVDEGSNSEPSMQPSSSQDQANLQHDIGHRRHCSPDDGAGCGPVEDSIAQHGQADDVTQPPRKRRGIRTSSPTTRGTAPEPQTRLHRAGSQSPQARLRTSQRPKPRRRQGLRSSDVLDDRGEQESETDEAPVAKFEEWPLGNAVLKRVIMGDAPPTFVVQFTWDPYANHGLENRNSVSSAKRHHPAKQKSTTFMKNEATSAKAKPSLGRARYTLEDDAKIR
ncbi:hypothetical protein C8A00DRAFT_19606 [Chaetomidium leptoderma]|uniref:Uncharacterized protein n=1 Tax=Chaetomidium leptoderma TaxID=669021 RepID=A0AAN6VDN3_9PEZI|nr:hypothetical protein C8A00DRAFT_19606 [Chaetomidium leptoderma]